MESDGTRRTLSQQTARHRQISAALSAYFTAKIDKIKAVPSDIDVIKCSCTVPRGYWFGLPLIHQRTPQLVELNELLIINFSDKVKVKHGTCIHCNTLYFSIKEDKYADSLRVCEKHSEAES